MNFNLTITVKLPICLVLTHFFSTYCNVVQFVPGCPCISECESDDRSGGAIGEEDIETAKSEFRLGIKCIVHRVFIYS